MDDVPEQETLNALETASVASVQLRLLGRACDSAAESAGLLGRRLTLLDALTGPFVEPHNPSTAANP